MLYQLGELDFNAGDPNAALEHYRNALAASPDDLAALAGKAKAEAALGQVETALDDYATLVARAPEPSYLLEYGELLESLGRIDEATTARLCGDMMHGDTISPLRVGPCLG